MDLLKRKYKSKLRKGYTHSLGLKALSENLFDCKHYSDLELSFTDDMDQRLGVYVPGWYDGRKLKGYSKDLLSFESLVSAHYSEVKREWSLELFPVELERNKMAKTILIMHGLPAIKAWLDAIEDETWYTGNRYLQIGIDYKKREYCIFETQNDRIIDKRVEKHELKRYYETR